MAKLPWFPFWPSDFLSDENVLVMSNEEVGIYVKLLCHQWKEGSIPKDGKAMAKLSGCDTDAMTTAWQAVGKCFAELSGNPGRLANIRMEAEREKQQNKRKARQDAGLRGAAARWQPHSNAKILPLAKNGESEVESESESDDKDPPKPPLKGEPAEPPQPPNKPKASKSNSKRRTRKGSPSALPDGFTPTQASVEWFRNCFGEVQRSLVESQTEQFKNAALRDGKVFVDWQAAWKTWMNNWQTDFGKKPPPQNGAGKKPGEPRPWEAHGDPNLFRPDDDEPGKSKLP